MHAENQFLLRKVASLLATRCEAKKESSVSVHDNLAEIGVYWRTSLDDPLQGLAAGSRGSDLPIKANEWPRRFFAERTR